MLEIDSEPAPLIEERQKSEIYAAEDSSNDKAKHYRRHNIIKMIISSKVISNRNP